METKNWDEFQSRLCFIYSRSIVRPAVLSLLFLSLFLSCTIPAHTQELPSSFVPVVAEVLSNSSIRCFYKDSKGYMWIGTEDDGLIRYDGSNAYRYVHDPNDKTSLSHSSVNTLLEGKDNQLWIGTAQGLCIYNRQLDSFINVDSIKENRNYLNNRYITDLEFDRQGRLWIGTHEGGINVYDPVKKSFEYIIDSPHGGIMPSTNFINILVNIGDTMWSASKGGLLLYNTQSKNRVPLNSLERFSNAQITSIVPDQSGSILIVTVTGEITRLNPENEHYSFQEILSGKELGDSPNILTSSFDRKGNILVGGENSGFNIIEQKTLKVNRLLAEEGNANRLPTNSIQSIFVDDLGLIWIGTFNNGAFLLNNNRKKFEGLGMWNGKVRFKSNDVRSFAEDDQGNIWLAFYGSGIVRINPVDNSLQTVHEINCKLSNKNITSIIYDKRGDLWLATAGKGVFRINTKTNQLVNYTIKSAGFGNDQVFCLYEDTRGTIWAGTWGSGLFFYEKDSSKFVNAIDYGLPDHIPNTAYISDIIEDSEGTLWVGTLFGLYELSRNGADSFSYRMHIPDSRDGSIVGAQIQAIAEDKDQNLWVGTSDGLNVKRKGSSKFEAYQMNKGAVTNSIRSVVIDDQGNVWMGGINGLSKFDVSTKTFIHYTVADGLRSNNFHRKASLRNSAGKLFFGSNNGFDSFYPDSIRTSPVKGTVVLTDLKINNLSIKPGVPGSPLEKHISLTSNLELSYDQRSFVIDFVTVDYSLSSQYTYCYKLEGFDTDWNCSATNHGATYTNIDPGDYVFLVKSANRDGVWIDNPIRLNITIQQVFWKRWWAFIIYAVMVILLVYILMRVRIVRLKLKNEIMFERLMREREQELIESKTQFFTNIAHEFRTPLSLVLLPLESLMGTNDVPAELRERIFTAYKNADRMNRLVNELLDFNKLEGGNLKLNVRHGNLVQFIRETSFAFNEMAVKRKINFSVNFESPEITGWFDPNNLERVIFNVLSNAFKFTTENGDIHLQVSTKYSIIRDGSLCKCVELLIKDNGIGISPEELPRIFEKFYQAKSSATISSPGTGIGLSFTKVLVELHHGTITAESVPDHSTIFTILLPLDVNAFHPDEIIEAPLNAELLTELKDEIISEVDYGDSDNDSNKPRILIVEDNFELRDYLVAELRKEFNVLEAKDGAEGLAIALEKNPDLIISDIMMPQKDGIELCNAIKSDLNTSHIPFILLTAKTATEDQIKGIETGADLYLAKPFSIRYLTTHIRQIIATRQRLYSRFSQDVYLLPGKTTTNALDQEFLQKAIDYVMANLQDPQLGVDSIAAHFNLSRTQIYRKIKALTGKPVVELIRMIRMKQAITLMDSHKLTLSEIAFEVGFNSPAYFTRCFKEEYGKTPSEYLGQN